MWSRWCATATSSPWWPNTRRPRCGRRTFCAATRTGISDRHCPTRTSCPPSSPRRPRRPRWSQTSGTATTSGVARSFAATYHRPYLAHGSIGPSCAVAVAARRPPRDLDAQPGRAHAAPRDRPGTRDSSGPTSWSGTSTARAATGTTAPTTRRWTPRCSRWPHRADRCRWCGREPTNWAGHLWDPPAWCDSRPDARPTAP